MPTENRVETEQHDRRERIKELWCCGGQTGRQVHETAPVQQVHASTVDLVPVEMSTQRGVGTLIEPVDIDLAVAVTHIQEDRAVGEALDLCACDHAITTGSGDDHAGST